MKSIDQRKEEFDMWVETLDDFIETALAINTTNW